MTNHEIKQTKVYLATPVGDPNTPERRLAEEALAILEDKGFDVYAPWKLKIPNAWDYPNSEWGRLVFESDVVALNNAELVVVLSYGRMSTAGVNWEAGYSYASGKKVIVVEMTGEIMSIMVANGRWATVKGLEGLREYDFATMPESRTETEVK